MHAKPILFVATAKPKESRAFYEETMGLTFIAEHPYAIVFETGGIVLRVQKVAQMTPAPYTAMGWEVADIYSTVKELSDKGVGFEHYPFLTQDKEGVWKTPDNAGVAWFKDPDGNTLSITQTNLS